MKTQNKLIAALQTKDTTTFNGALSHSTTGSAIVDLFGKGAAMRSSTDEQAMELFAAAYGENKFLAVKTLFYIGDIRGGQGERKFFRNCLRWLVGHDEKVTIALLPIIPIYRRWDDITEALVGTPLEKLAIATLAFQLAVDSQTPIGQPITLAGKWAPSEQASSALTKSLATKVRDELELTPREYRKLLSGLRQRLNVVERKMSANEWEQIEFSKVPSRAAMIYKSAFKRHTPDLYSAFLTKVEKGEAKINASTLYPYDIVREIMHKIGDDARTLEAQWKAQPDYLADNPHNGIVVADVSGSMTSSGFYGGKDTGQVAPIYVCLSLAIYFAERNTGAFKDYFLTFSQNSKLQKLKGTTLKEKAMNLNQAEWHGNTNLQSAFQCILTAAVANKVPKKDMPNVVYIISDMQFDVAVSDNSMTNLKAIEVAYINAGYDVPRIVFWNVNSHDDVQVKVDDKGVCLVSGCSPSILKTVLGGKVMTPLDTVLQTINVERYVPVEKALDSAIMHGEG